jgi:NSS family neurotransmitter:Na+ symporter
LDAPLKTDNVGDGTGTGMLVYGSYLSKKSNVPHAAFSIVSLDTVIALVAALVIMPATFAYGLDPASGPPLLFITSLEVFTHMPEGRVIAILFFLGVLFAAVTSIFIMMETIVEAMMDRFQVRRKQSMFWVVTVTFLAGIPLAINMAWFEKAVDIITVYLVPLGAVMAGFLFFWVFSVKKARAEINIGARKPVGEWWEPVAKYIFVGISFAIIFLQIVFRIGG